MKKFITLLILLCVGTGVWFVYTEIYTAQASVAESVTFEIISGETAAQVADRLEEEHIIRNAWIFKKYLSHKELDTKIRAGSFEVTSPITLARVAEVLDKPSIQEKEITILPGWTIYNISTYLSEQGYGTEEEITALLGKPAQSDSPLLIFEEAPRVLQELPVNISLEGYLRPDTFRVYVDDTLEDVLKKLIVERDGQITDEIYAEVEVSGHTFHEILTMASILEKEVRSEEDKRRVSDILWRRYDANWALQVDSSVHYIFGKTDSVFTTPDMRSSLNTYNTYQYPGLPPGPISTPSMQSILAALRPEANDNWYFLTTLDTGEVKYAASLEEHNRNVVKYLR